MKKPPYIRAISTSGMTYDPEGTNAGRYFVAEINTENGHARILDPIKGYKCVAVLNETIEDKKEFELALRKTVRAVLKAEALVDRRKNKGQDMPSKPAFMLVDPELTEASDLTQGGAPTKHKAAAKGQHAPWAKRKK